MEPKYEWDEDKRRANLEKHGIDFSAVYDFDWATATFLPDDRSGEYRTKAYGLIEERLHLIGVYCSRRQDANHQFTQSQFAGGETI